MSWRRRSCTCQPRPVSRLQGPRRRVIKWLTLSGLDCADKRLLHPARDYQRRECDQDVERSAVEGTRRNELARARSRLVDLPSTRTYH